jgi:hypothetical protein
MKRTSLDKGSSGKVDLPLHGISMKAISMGKDLDGFVP